MFVLSARYTNAMTSKNLFPLLRSSPSIETANMKFYYGEFLRVVKMGSLRLIISRVYVMVVLLRVSIIMLAKPINMAMMIPREKIPPVVVLY